jgi:hypothetical protein
MSTPKFKLGDIVEVLSMHGELGEVTGFDDFILGYYDYKVVLLTGAKKGFVFWLAEDLLAANKTFNSVQQAANQAHNQAQSQTPSNPIGQSLNAQPAGSNQQPMGVPMSIPSSNGTSYSYKGFPKGTIVQDSIGQLGMIIYYDQISLIPYQVLWESGVTSIHPTIDIVNFSSNYQATKLNKVPLTCSPPPSIANTPSINRPNSTPTPTGISSLPKAKTVQCDCGSICNKCWV